MGCRLNRIAIWATVFFASFRLVSRCVALNCFEVDRVVNLWEERIRWVVNLPVPFYLTQQLRGKNKGEEERERNPHLWEICGKYITFSANWV